MVTLDQKRLVRISKHLRHSPERLGLTLERGGWVLVADLLDACATQGFPAHRGGTRPGRGTEGQAALLVRRDADQAPGEPGSQRPGRLLLTPRVPPKRALPRHQHGTLDSILREGLRRSAWALRSPPRPGSWLDVGSTGGLALSNWLEGVRVVVTPWSRILWNETGPDRTKGTALLIRCRSEPPGRTRRD